MTFLRVSYINRTALPKIRQERFFVYSLFLFRTGIKRFYFSGLTP